MVCTPENFAVPRSSRTRSSLHAHTLLEVVVPKFLTQAQVTANVA